MPSPKFRGQVKERRLRIQDITRWNKHLDALNGEHVEIIVDKPKKIRSIKQNALYWLYLTMLEREGMGAGTKEDSHEYFKWKFLKEGWKETKTGEKYPIVKSTTELEKHEFSNYLEKIEQETGIPIPNPDHFYD